MVLACLIQPPNIFPISTKISVREIYFCCLIALVSNDSRKRTLRISSFAKDFLGKELQLEFHQKKVSFRKLSWGIDFVGYVALPHYQVLRTKTKKRIFRKIKVKVGKYNLGALEQKSLNQSLQSYFGVFKHGQSYEIEKSLKNYILNNLVP